MKHHNFQYYIELSASAVKDTPRSACIIFLRDQITAGLWPSNPTQPQLREYLRSLPYEHRHAAGRLWKDYSRWKTMREWSAKQRLLERARRDSIARLAKVPIKRSRASRILGWE